MAFHGGATGDDVSVVILEDFLRVRFRGWHVPGAVAHRGAYAQIESPNDCIAVPVHGVSVMRWEYESWLDAGHDPGDEDR